MGSIAFALITGGQWFVFLLHTWRHFQEACEELYWTKASEKVMGHKRWVSLLLIFIWTLTDETILKKIGPPLVLLFIGLYFWWFETNPTELRKSGESIPAQILTTWKTGSTKLTLYQASSGDEVEGYWFNPKTNHIYTLLKGHYRNSAVSGEWFVWA